MSEKLYTEALADQILDAVREGQTLAAFCRETKISLRAVYYWKGKNVCGFGDRYYHACQDRACAWADEIVTIADDCPPREIDIKRAGLKIRTRQWLIEKCHPAVFEAVPRVQQPDEDIAVVSPTDFLKSWKANHASDVVQ